MAFGLGDLCTLFIYLIIKTYLIFIQGSTFRINYSVFQNGPVSTKVDKHHVNVKIKYTIK